MPQLKLTTVLPTGFPPSALQAFLLQVPADAAISIVTHLQGPESYEIQAEWLTKAPAAAAPIHTHRPAAVETPRRSDWVY